MRKFPFAVDDPKCDVFVRRACTEMQEYRLIISGLLDDFVSRRLGLINEVGVKYVELHVWVSRDRRIYTRDSYLISLDDLGGRVIGTERGVNIVQPSTRRKCSLVMCLVVLVPLVTGVDPVEVPRFPRPVLVLPVV